MAITPLRRQPRAAGRKKEGPGELKKESGPKMVVLLG
jgi:hypothetical protein